MTISIIIILIGLTGSAFISATEIALIGSRRFRISNLAEQGDQRAIFVTRVLENHEKFFGTILLLGNVFNIIVASVGTNLAITTIGGGQPSIASTISATVVATILIVIIGELTPKTLAALIAEKWALNTARFVLIMMTVTGPFVYAFTLVPRVFVHLIGGKESLTSPAVTSDELQLLIDIGEEEGTVESTQGEMLDNIFRFGELAVRDIMTPRPEIIWVSADMTFKEFLKTYKENPHTRFPVFDEDYDDVVGILSIKDVMVSQAEGKLNKSKTVTRLMRTALFTPETKLLDDLFEDMQQSGHKIALAVDEFGGIAGLITLTRMIEQIVGRSGEEGRRPEQRFVEINENTYMVDGGMPIDEANSELNLDIPEGEYETLAGFFLEHLQSIPQIDTRIRFGNSRFQVIEMNDKRISRLRIRRTPDLITSDTDLKNENN